MLRPVSHLAFIPLVPHLCLFRSIAPHVCYPQLPMPQTRSSRRANMSNATSASPQGTSGGIVKKRTRNKPTATPTTHPVPLSLSKRTAKKDTATPTPTSTGLDNAEQHHEEPSYFLIKSEPESRIQDGHEMKFSIDDLVAEDNATTHWDGVRNYEARNIMREMHVEDRALFYHSNTKKSRPAIVGEVCVVRESYPDHTAFDEKDPHFDPKSDLQNPRWFMVDVKFVRKFDRHVSLDDIKAEPKLANMQLVKRGRISVQRVTPEEWDIVLGMAGALRDDTDDKDK